LFQQKEYPCSESMFKIFSTFAARSLVVTR